MTDAILVENLVVRYKTKGGKSVHAVNGLSFSVHPGEIVGFLGPNGAGKSSTLKVLMGFIQATSGQASVFGAPCGTADSKRRIGYLPEVALYYQHLTPRETLILFGELQGIPKSELKKQAAELLNMVGLSQHMDRQNRLLSKGQLQRVGIAQSLLGNPELLILDEVTSGIDPIGRHELRTLLLQKRSEGCTLFFSSHELSEVETLCDRVLMIHLGKLIESHDVRRLRTEIGTFEIRFRPVGPVSIQNAALSELENSEIVAKFESKDQLLLGLGEVLAQKHDLKDVNVNEGNLEDYFVETIRRAA